VREGHPVGPKRADTDEWGHAPAKTIYQIGAALDLVADGRSARFVCQKCGHGLSDATEDPKTGALEREIAMDTLSAWNRFGLTSEIVVREFFCPSCGHLIAVEVRRKEDAILYDTHIEALNAPSES
jgi:acetone carboxylase gamma subunit